MLAAAAGGIAADTSPVGRTVLAGLLLGGTCGLLVYAGLIYKWLRGFTQRVNRASMPAVQPVALRPRRSRSTTP